MWVFYTKKNMCFISHIVIEPEGPLQYLGYFHPFINDFPIVLVYVTLFFDFLFLYTKQEMYTRIARGMLLAAGIFAIPTAITGWMAWSLGLQNNPYVSIHLTFAIITICYIWIHTFIRFYYAQEKRISYFYALFILSCLNVTFINITGEYGGMITWGHGIFMRAP